MELTKGDLRDPRRAFVPVAAAAGGVALPALLYSAINAANPETLGGWAIPAATDIAFAVAVLAIVGSKLPAALRTFLLTLAIVDDLIAITIIAVFYSSDLKLHYLAFALIPLALYWLVANKAEALFKKHYSAAWFVLLPLGLIVWALFYNSGIHATIAGVALAFMIRLPKRSSTVSARSPRASPCRSLHSLARASPSAASAGSPRRGPQALRSGSSSVSSQERCSASWEQRSS